MKIKLFYHSLVSDWNNGNAHFLRGYSRELQSLGHKVEIYEPKNSWSRSNLIKDHSEKVLEEFHNYYPTLKTNFYSDKNIDLDGILNDADAVIVHEWNEPDLVKNIGEHHKKNNSYLLFFHDTHHRSATNPKAMSKYDLSRYDGVLAFGETVKNIYKKNNWSENVFVWHEAADTKIFHSIESEKEGDVVWIGNWGDDERAAEIEEFFIEPVKKLNLKAKIYGVRYPEKALKKLEKAGIGYGGWLPNYKVPEVFSKYRITIHIPRGPYVDKLPGIPTIRPFEALACKIPLISAPWIDSEKMFTEGKDFLFAENKTEVGEKIKMILSDSNFKESLKENGLRTILKNHTCKHRAEQLIKIFEEVSSKKEMVESKI